MRISMIGAAARWIVVVAIVAIAGAYAILATPLFRGFRQEIAQNLIARVLDRPSVVDGDVSVAFGGGLRIGVESVKLPPDDTRATPLPNQFIEKIDFVLPYSAVFFRAGDVTKFHLSGIQIDFGDVAKESGSAASRQSETGLGSLISEFLNNDVSGDLRVTDLLARYHDSVNGWDEELRIDQFVSRLSVDGQFVEIEVSAKINTTELVSSGRVQSVRYDPTQHDLPFEFQFTLPGGEARLAGSLNVSGQSAAMSGDVHLMSDSIGQLLDDLQIKRTIDGRMTLNAKLQGPVNNLQAKAIQLNATLNSGDKIAVSGDIADISAGEGVALDFSVAFPDIAARRQAENILDLEIVGFQGRLEGAIERLGLSETVIRTNIANVELAEIGPISIGRVVRGREAQMGLRDILILDGPPDRPTMQLRGHVDDLLGFSSVKLEGTLDFPIHTILGAVPVSDTGQLGRFAGDVIISDEGGSLGIDQLNGTIVDTDIWSLTVVFALGAIRNLDEIVLDTDLSILDLKSFATAIGKSVDSDGGLSFAGDFLLRDKSLELRGAAKVIDTEIDGNLFIGSVEGRQQILGSLRSDHVKLPDLAVPIELFAVEVPENVDLEISEEIQESLRVALDLDFEKITDGEDATGKLTGHLEYADEIAKLSDFTLGYLGGTVSGNISGNFQEEVPTYAADVRVKKWRMGRLLGELGLRAPISGTVYLSVDLQAKGEQPRSWVKTMSGTLTASLWGGRVPGRLLDLTGLNLVRWLAVKQAKSDSTKIVCAVIPVRLKQGAANGRSMILETENVQIVGGGTVNFNNSALKLAFMPRAKKEQFVDIVSPFRISGTFSNPKVKLEGGKGGRVIAEVVTLPLNVIGQLFTGSKPIPKKEKPCVLPRNSRPK